MKIIFDEWTSLKIAHPHNCGFIVTIFFKNILHSEKDHEVDQHYTKPI